MKGAARALLALLALPTCTAASDRHERTTDAASAGVAARPPSGEGLAPAPTGTPQTLARKSLLRVVAREGEVTGVGIEDAPPIDRLVRLGPDATLELLLADHAKLRVQGPASLLIGPGGAPALLLREGVLTVDCAAPVLPTAAPALWVATAFARLEVAQRARFVVHAAPRASVLSIASGDVRVRQNDAVHDLSGDATVCMSTRARWSHQRLRGKLETRGQEIRALPRCAPVLHEPTDAGLGDALGEVLGALEEAEQRGRELVASHRALSQSDARGAAEQQRAIALHAATTMRLADEVRARASVLAARTLGRASPALRALLDRATRAAP